MRNNSCVPVRALHIRHTNYCLHAMTTPTRVQVYNNWLINFWKGAGLNITNEILCVCVCVCVCLFVTGHSHCHAPNSYPAVLWLMTNFSTKS